MAAATVINGNDVGLYVNDQLIGCLTSNGFNATNKEIDVTCKDNGGARQILAGGNEAEFSFEGMFNPASGFGFVDLLAIHANKSTVQVKQLLDDQLAIVAYAKLNTLSWNGDVNAGSTFSGTFTIDGDWDFDISPTPGDSWILANGSWDDDGLWDDSEYWVD